MLTPSKERARTTLNSGPYRSRVSVRPSTASPYKSTRLTGDYALETVSSDRLIDARNRSDSECVFVSMDTRRLALLMARRRGEGGTPSVVLVSYNDNENLR